MDQAIKIMVDKNLHNDEIASEQQNPRDEWREKKESDNWLNKFNMVTKEGEIPAIQHDFADALWRVYIFYGLKM